MKKLQDCEDKLIEEREKWQKRLNVLDEELDKSRTIIHDKKQYYRNIMIETIDRLVDKEEELKELNSGLKEMNYKLAQQLKVSTKETRAAQKLRDHWKSLSQKRQAKLKETKAEKDWLKDELARVSKLADQQKKTLDKYQAMLEQ